MNKSISLNELLNDIKANDESTKLFIEAADKSVEIIDKIVKAREKLGLTQRELAKKCGIKQPALARIETYKVIPKINTLIKLAEAVGITIEAMEIKDKQVFQRIYAVGVMVVQSSYNTEKVNYEDFIEKGDNRDYKWKPSSIVSALL